MTSLNSKLSGFSEEQFSSETSRVASPPPHSQSQRSHPQPRYLRNPTTLESISSAFTGISSYVRKSIPDSLLTKAFQTRPLFHPSPVSPSSSFPPSFGGESLRVRGIEGQPRSRVTFAAFDHLKESHSGMRRLCLLLGYVDGFHVWELDDIGKISELALVRLELGDVVGLKFVNPGVEKHELPKMLISSTRTLPSTPNAEFQAPQHREEFFVLTLYCLTTRSPAAQRVFEREAIAAIDSNDRCVIVATTLPCIRVLSRTDLADRWVFIDVFPNPNTQRPVFALGPRWLAYSTNLETPWKANFPESPGLRKNVKVDRMAKDVVNGLKLIGDYGYHHLNTYLKYSPEFDPTLPPRGPADSNPGGPTSSSLEERGFSKSPGRVVVRDLVPLEVGSDTPSMSSEEVLGMSSVAHFQCHYCPINNLAFNGTGNLLATSSVEGHTFYIFEITQCQPPLPPFRTLYKLSRGFTDARVINMTFNEDSRWLATTTHHGTTHLFLINPYGGLPHTASHLKAQVLNGAYAVHPTSLAPGVRIRQKQVDAPEEANAVSVRGESVCAVHFLPSSLGLSRWLSQLPPAYDFPPGATRASSIVLMVDSEGVLKLLRVSVFKKAPPLNPGDKSSPQDAVSTHAESIAEWALAKLPADTEKWFSPVKGQPSSEACKSLCRSPQYEPEMAWLPFVETRTHDPSDGPSRPLWTLRQFDFRIYCEGGDETFEPSCFTKDQRRTRPLVMRHHNVPHLQGAFTSNDDLQAGSSHEELEGHLVHAMETKLDTPSVLKRVLRRKETLSFEDALEIHMVHPLRKAPEKPLTEIPMSYVEEEAAYHCSITHDVGDEQLGVFTMDELDCEALVGDDSVRSISPDSEVCLTGPAPGASGVGVDSLLALNSSTEDI